MNAPSPRLSLAVLLGIAAIGAVVRSSGAGSLGRVGGVFAALVMAGVAAGVLRGRLWALGGAFLLGLFWLWAVLALRIQGTIGVLEFVFWIAWAVVVIVMSVRSRIPDAG